MKIKYSFIGFVGILIFLQNVCYSQVLFINKYNHSVDSLKNRALQIIKQEKLYFKYADTLNKANFLLIPCYNNAGVLDTGVEELSNLKLDLDSSILSYQIYFQSGKFVILPQIYLGIKFIEDRVNPYSFHGNPFIYMYNYVKKYSNIIFVLRIRGGEDTRGNLIMGYVYQEKLYIIAINGRDALGNYKIEEFDNLREYVIYRYGSVDKYLDLVKYDSLSRRSR